jgi:hypothetical protein
MMPEDSSSVKIHIVSGTDRPLLRSEVNHRQYAATHGYDYFFDSSLYPHLSSPFYRKLVSTQQTLHDCNWTFWLDDDAFFTDFSIKLEDFLLDLPEEIFLVLCASPVNQKGGWTYISSGQFFLRNDDRARDFINLVLSTSLKTVHDWWDSSRYGMFTNGDQDAIVYTLVTRNLLPHTHIYPYDAFNNRPYHYSRRLDEHFVVHFPGLSNKRKAVRDFGAHFRVDDTLVASGYGPIQSEVVRESCLGWLRKKIQVLGKRTDQ